MLNAIQWGRNHVIDPLQYSRFERGLATSLTVVGATACVAMLTSASASLALTLGAVILFAANLYNFYLPTPEGHFQALVKLGEFTEALRFVQGRAGLSGEFCEVCSALCDYLVQNQDLSDEQVDAAAQLLGGLTEMSWGGDNPEWWSLSLAVAEALLSQLESSEEISDKNLRRLLQRPDMRPAADKLWRSAASACFSDGRFIGGRRVSPEQSEQDLRSIGSFFMEKWELEIDQKTFHSVMDLCDSIPKTYGIITALRTLAPELCLADGLFIFKLFPSHHALVKMYGEKSGLELSFGIFNSYIEEVRDPKSLTKLFWGIKTGGRDLCDKPGYKPSADHLKTFLRAKTRLLIAIYEKSEAAREDGYLSRELIAYALDECIGSADWHVNAVFAPIVRALQERNPEVFKELDEPLFVKLINKAADITFFEAAADCGIDLRGGKVETVIHKEKARLKELRGQVNERLSAIDEESQVLDANFRNMDADTTNIGALGYAVGTVATNLDRVEALSRESEDLFKKSEWYDAILAILMSHTES